MTKVAVIQIVPFWFCFLSLTAVIFLSLQGLIYRFEFLMVVTVLCAGFTVVFFIISSVNEAQWKFGDEESTVEISSKKYV